MNKGMGKEGSKTLVYTVYGIHGEVQQPPLDATPREERGRGVGA